MSDSTQAPLLSVRDLTVAFRGRGGETRPVRGISFDVHRGQRLGLVGESGSGKSLTAFSIMRLLKEPGRIAGGEVVLDGQNLLQLAPREMATVRGGRIAMIYQDPLSALNPVQTIGHQLDEAIRQHLALDKEAARRRSIELLGEVGVPHPAQRADSYPHQFSGGMLQRVVIAMALCCDPELLIADEATTALDVTTQARIVELLLDLVERRDTAVIFITHDLGVAAALCEDIQVMYAGRIVERASAPLFYARSVHPYSEALLGAMCRLDAVPGERLPAIAGSPPVAGVFPAGCAFHPRCPYAAEICTREAPPVLLTGEREGFAECHFARERLDGEPLARAGELGRGES
ncbi:MAG: ABC transporter ATP-binding protein [Solirubrobacterales bacterium]